MTKDSGKRITLVDGHPDPDRRRFCHALADAYAAGAERKGHSLRRLTLSELDLPLLRTRDEWEHAEPTAVIRTCQDAIGWAEHVVIIYPLWLGSLPALLKAFLEQVLRPGFAFERGGTMKPGALKGKSARVIITMGMPSAIYRWYFGAHSLKSLERNILKFVGIKPVRATLIGSVESGGERRHGNYLNKIGRLGERAR